jgi:transcriptional regulator with XRE-family HTH domain
MLQQLIDTRKRLRLTQSKMSRLLGISRNYLALIETGRRPLPSSVVTKLEEINSFSVTNVSTPTAPPASPCRYPEACDIQAEFGQLREEMASITAQLDTVTRLLGAALGSALPAQRDHNQPHPHKAHPHRAAG